MDSKFTILEFPKRSKFRVQLVRVLPIPNLDPRRVAAAKLIAAWLVGYAVGVMVKK